VLQQRIDTFSDNFNKILHKWVEFFSCYYCIIN